MRLRSRTLPLVSIAILWLFVVSLAARAESHGSLTILLSNDDGYDAPGLRALAQALAPLGKVVVVAPLENQSGTGHGTTTREFVRVQKVEILPGLESYGVAGRPATCVRLGLESLLSEKPDLVVSGINRGTNLGVATYYSGTVAAAREAVFVGIPALAVSMAGNDSDDYASTAALVARLVRDLDARGRLQPGLFLNINAPAGKPRGVRITRQSTRATPQLFAPYQNPRGDTYYWSDYRPLQEEEEGTDVWAVLEGQVSITPLQIDQSRVADLDWLRDFVPEPAPAAPR